MVLLVAGVAPGDAVAKNSSADFEAGSAGGAAGAGVGEGGISSAGGVGVNFVVVAYIQDKIPKL